MLLTTAEAVELGYVFDKEPPKPEICKYCGKELLYLGMSAVTEKKINMWFSLPQRCTCNEAIEHWKRYDQKQSEKQASINAQIKSEKMIARAERMVGDNALKKRFAQRTFATFIIAPENKEAFETAKQYAEHFREYAENGTGLYMEGTNGTGKTHLAAAITNHLMEHGIPVICKTSIALLDDIKRAYGDQAQYTDSQMLDLYKNIDLLIIDDLGKEQCTEWSQHVIYSILNDRYEDMKPSCITTNFNEETLAERLRLPDGDNSHIQAIISRLHETNIDVTMVWPDYRGKEVQNAKP
jgi:DNA replication protein DnaC